MRLQPTRRLLALLLSLLACSPVVGAAGVDGVVFIDVAKGYQGTLWSGQGLPGVLPGTGTGSGFVIDVAAFLGDSATPAKCATDPATLLVVTNEHVARAASETIVTFFEQRADGEVARTAVPAELVAADQRADLALLRITPAAAKARGLDVSAVAHLRPFAGSVKELAGGTPVQALGNPEGLQRVVTTGVISASEQRLSNPYPYIPLFRMVQTDAAINGGNSGGPLLLASSGELVGVNSLGGAGQNLNFAIPVDRVRTFVRQVLCGGRIRHGELDVATSDVSERTQGLFGLASQTGCVVLRTLDDAGGEPGRLEDLDVILAVTGTRQPEAGGGSVTVKVGSDGPPLGEAAFDLEPGTPARLSVQRQGKLVDVTTTVSALDGRGMSSDDAVPAFGAWMERIMDDLRRERSLRENGLRCGYVRDGSIAAEAGLRSDDILQHVLLRDASGLRDVPVQDTASLRAPIAELEASVSHARAAGEPFVLGFEVLNLGDRGYHTRILRSGGSAR